MKKDNLVLIGILLALVLLIVGDRLYFAKMEKKFKALEEERIVTSNKLATAKIVSENLNHVRDLIFRNMDFQGKRYSLEQETDFFEFLTSCVNDLKLKLVSVKPMAPQVNGRITTFSYDIEIEGDFFGFGELCAKFENSRRITTIEKFDVELIDKPAEGQQYAPPPRSMQPPRKGQKAGFRPSDEPIYQGPPTGTVKVGLRVNTYWIKKV